jgi:transglutaminase-like putative cysteine protease
MLKHSKRIVVLAALLVPAFPAAGQGPPSYVLVWDFDATKAAPAATGEILIPLPSNEPYQKVKWELSGVRTQRVINLEGGKLVAVRPSGPNFRLRVTVEPTATDIARPGRKLPVPADAAACLRDNAAFAARNPETARLAKELKADDPAQTVRNIRDWIKENMTYRYDPALKQKETAPAGGVDSILKAKCGDCGGQSRLFVCLCRQAGVPARGLWGAIKIVGPEAIPKETGLPLEKVEPGDFCGHAWAEVFVKDWGWIPVEPQPFGPPLGQVPQEFVPFVRLEPVAATMADASLAIGNVWAMNYIAKREKPGNKPPAKK